MKKIVLSFILIMSMISPLLADDGTAVSPLKRQSLLLNINSPEVYKPTGAVIGEQTFFKIKAEPQSHIMFITSFDNIGAPAILGQKLRLGFEYNIIESTVSESGIVEIPVNLEKNKELLDKNLYFEALVWKNEDFGDIRVARIMAANGRETESNEVNIKAPLKDPSIPSFSPSISGLSPELVTAVQNIKNDSNSAKERLEYEYPQNTPAVLKNLDAPELMK
jgi:hypothetical protein